MRQILPSLVGWVEGMARLLGELVHRNSEGAGAHEIDLGALEGVLDVPGRERWRGGRERCVPAHGERTGTSWRVLSSEF